MSSHSDSQSSSDVSQPPQKEASRDREVRYKTMHDIVASQVVIVTWAAADGVAFMAGFGKVEMVR